MISVQKTILQEGLVKMRNRFNEQLEYLNKKMIEMGSLCEDLISIAVTSLIEGNVEKAKAVVPLGSDVDRMEKEIESICLKLLLQQQLLQHEHYEQRFLQQFFHQQVS